MINLYNRLKPDVLASINKDQQRYPYTTRSLKIKLQSSYDWSELSVGNVQSIFSHSHVSLIDVKQEDLLFGDSFLVKC